MTASSTTAVILGGVADFSGAVFVIISAALGIGLAYLVFLFGWSKVKTSLDAGSSSFMFELHSSEAVDLAYSMGRKAGYGNEEFFERDWEIYKKKVKNADRDEFGEMYFDV